MLRETQAMSSSSPSPAPGRPGHPVRIVHYYPRALAGDGGCTASVRGWASAEAQSGADVVLAGDPGRGEAPNGVRYVELTRRGWRGLKGPVGMQDVLDQADLLVLHSGWVLHNVIAARAADRAGVPYIATPHGAYNPNVFGRRRVAKSVWWTLFERRVLLGARAVHVFFEEEIEFVTAVGYRGSFVISPNGVTLPTFEDHPRRRGYALWMGRFDVETKGIDLVLHAYARLPKESRPPLRLHGPDWRGGKERTRKMVQDLRLGDSVTIGPATYGDEKWRLLRGCDLFLFTPRWDSSSVMALEAAGAEAPMVATTATFVGRQLAAGGGAILVDPTIDGIAAGIVEGLDERGPELGHRAGAIVRERFTWSAVSQRLLHQLESLR